MTSRKGFLGADGFYWWIGVVENRKDPLNIGRCQIRMVGWHTDNKNEIPTADLPWAQPLLPTNGSRTYTTPKEGDRVMGFFMDGESAQFPVIMGVIPGIPDEKPDPSKGFSDPRSAEELKSAPNVPKEVKYNTDGTGVKIENQPAENYPNTLDEPANTRMVRNEKIEETPFNDTLTNNVKKVPVAQYKDINPKGLSISPKSGFDMLGGFSGIFSSFSSLIPSSISNLMSMVMPASSGSINIPGILSKQISEALPEAASATINKISNVGVISSSLSDLGIRNFDASNVLHVESLSNLPSVSKSNLGNIIDLYDKKSIISPDFQSLKTDLTDSGIDLGSIKDEEFLSSLKDSGVDMGAVSKTLSLNNLENALDLSSLTENLNGLGVTLFSGDKQSSDTQWTEPKSKYNTQYPYNTVTETESGHIFELDDTVGKERVNIRHRSGTFVEMHPDGSRVQKIVKDNYSVTMADDHVQIMGNCKVTINGNSNVYIQKDCILNVDGNLNTTVKKDWNLNIDGNINWNVGGNYISTIRGDATAIINGNSSEMSHKSITKTSAGDFGQASTTGKMTISSSGELYLISENKVAIDAPQVGTNVFTS